MTALSTPNTSVTRPDHGDEVTPPRRLLNAKGRIIPSLVFAIGYILSPLSWWNDLFVNLPLAWLLGNVMNFFVPGSFNLAMIVAYWLSNLAGILFMFWGGSRMLGKQPPKRQEIWSSIAISLLYTAAIYLLMRWGIVRPFQF